MAKAKFEVEKGLGQAMAVASPFTRVISEMGGDNDDFVALTTPAGDTFLTECAKRWMGLRRPAPPVFVPKLPKVVAEHPLRKQFKTTAEALAAGAYPDGHDSYISDATYPLRTGMQEDTDLVGLDVRESFDHEPTTVEVLALASQYGYERPVYEDGLRDGAEHSGEDYERPHVYLHEPDAGGGVLYRYWWRDDRRLSRSFGRPGDHWRRARCVFFFRRPSTKA